MPFACFNLNCANPKISCHLASFFLTLKKSESGCVDIFLACASRISRAFFLLSKSCDSFVFRMLLFCIVGSNETEQKAKRELCVMEKFSPFVFQMGVHLSAIQAHQLAQIQQAQQAYIAVTLLA